MDTAGMISAVRDILASRSLDGWEITAASSRLLSIEVKEQKVDTFKCSAPLGVSVRVLKNGGMGFSFSTSMAPEDLARMVDNALVGAESQTPDADHGFPDPSVAYPDVPGLFDDGLAAVAEEAKIAVALDLERLTLAADPRVRKVRKATYGDSMVETMVVNSRGVSGRYRGTSVSASVTAVAEENGQSQMGWDFDFSSRFGGISVERIVAGAVAKATGLLGAATVPTMRCPAVLDTYVATEILEVLAPAFLAENVQKGKSLLAGKRGEMIVAPLLTIRDDGTLPGGMGTAPFDAEGVPKRNTVLVESGRLAGYLYDTLRARKEGVASTGNAIRSGIKSPPHMGVSNLFIENGTEAPEALLAGIARGVLLTEVMGMHTANTISGDFSVGAAGFLVEDGRVVRPVKGIAIAGNILELFRGVEAVGNDLRFYGTVGAPSLRIAALDVSGV
ncbi:TldD/PmbA family protein [Geobacter sulfurreducens]|uniref:TldD/PmbA family protein n=1 Tax=Geobacter sulfurreducens TaxID=35554 RepID=UPI002BC545B7|nr:TldD/PmbA family protein [Geobacter sulfurreducens]HML77920.1 TldD/PmbA family protein [Geobacter sulfurreducens]